MSFRRPFSLGDDDKNQQDDPFAEFAPEPAKPSEQPGPEDWLAEFPDEKQTPTVPRARNWQRLNDDAKG